ncbi:glutathione S-transferase family protein [Salinarimonas chemoclinalis]|uniref:glutathione S-transferase family protein n=1 Tax=Salinarimonas chemoclinalis TaxID=3241599 RepID=UPI00355805A9
MITIYGRGRGFRVVRLLEEMGLPYRLRDVDMRAGVENDAEFLRINPAGFIPALVDGSATMVESIAIMEYLMARYGPTPLSPEPTSTAYPAYQQFLHLGEAGMAAAVFFAGNARRLPTEAERSNPTARHALRQYENRLTLVRRQLDRTPYLAGEAFTAADISVAYAIDLAERFADVAPGAEEAAHLARVRTRDAYARAVAACAKAAP